ncbi:MAG: CPBP family intramembrane metalloprotease [Candidatus Omnitrophica bacterium]|nr:CPBP family intramembrane metalloprotease [Candidatus Omnitrophota bacterium]
MKRFFGFIRQNKLYVVLFAFVLLINSLMLIGHMMERYLDEPESVQSVRISDRVPPSVKMSQEKLKELASGNPVLYVVLAALNLCILFGMFVGMIFDIYFVKRWIKKEPLEINIVPHAPPRWNIADVIRVVLIFLSVGYVLLILQEFFITRIALLCNSNFRMVFNTLVMNVVGISVIWYFIVKKYGQKISAVGLTSKGFVKSVCYAAIGYVAIIPILFGIMIATFYITEFFKVQMPVQSVVRIFINEKNTTVLFFSTIFAAIFGPVAEEIFFRGFMYKAVKKKMGAAVAVIITSVVFSLLHAHIVGIVPIFALGVLLAYLYEKTGSLTASIAVHISHNLAMVVLVFFMRSMSA